MSRGINKLIAIGNLGKDPEIRYLPSGQAVCNFSIAVSESWTDKQSGEVKERTEWMNIEVWGKAAEACSKYLTKGSQCYVEGKLQTDKWEKDGVTRYSTKVRADNVQFLGGKGDRPPQQTTEKTPPQQGDLGGSPPSPDDFDDDIPF
jgi:single-strand DNA-binding protein